MLLSALYRFLGALIEGADSEPGAAAAVLSKDRYVQKALEYIETNYSHSMSVESMADQIGLSRKYLARRFKEATGRTPQDFLVQYRISKAADLLSEPSLSVSEIAYSVGYRDPAAVLPHVQETARGLPLHYRRRLPGEKPPGL
ncbi:AraC family transcriptional regulator [Paenibacillus sp. P25]|nr:AraC family transcriptional regulator [Paenibacillus sp. P25]